MTSTNDPNVIAQSIGGASFSPADIVPTAKVATGKNFTDEKSLTAGGAYQDRSTVIIAPTRGMITWQVVQAWMQMMPIMNTGRIFAIVPGMEVGAAYNETIKNILAHPQLSKWKYVMTVEDDNIPPPDAQVRLINTLEKYKFDGVSGLYFLKGKGAPPHVYGDPERYRQSGVLDFIPLNIRDALAKGQVRECNGIAMGCAVYRMDLFKEIAAPWFKTQNEVTKEGPRVFTQDLYFCEKAKRAGKRFAVDMTVKVGHIDINTQEIW